MKKHMALCLSFFAGLLALAQPSQKDLTNYYLKKAESCGGIDSVMQKKGSWKKVEDDLAFPDKTFPTNQYKLVNARMDSMLSFFKEGSAEKNLTGRL